jgi:hypothetical protein
MSGAADVAPGDLIICDDGDGYFESWGPDPARVPAPAARLAAPPS